MIGDILDGKYRIDERLGEGGMGSVYLATHLGTTRVVALKVIAPKWAADPHFLARFQREAQACGRLRHPNIVNVTDFGTAGTARGSVAYLVMEFLDGLTLHAFQRDHPKPALPLVADLLDQIGLALTEAHRLGIVHRDLKPDNIWLEPNGRGGYTVKVLDFGVAKMNLPGDPSPPAGAAGHAELPDIDATETALIGTPTPAAETETIAMATPARAGSSGSSGGDAAGHTMPGSLVGTPAYMSPEQAFGKEIDFRSDIYSLAVIGYSLVCGRLPFGGGTGGLLAFHQSGSAPAPSAVRKVPGDVSDAILAGLARDPADRPSSAVAFTRRFHNAVDAEFLALRRSRAFLLQHLGAFALLLLPIYPFILGLCALLTSFTRKFVPLPGLQVAIVSATAVVLFVFADNLLRLAAALIALDERVRVRRFVAMRVLWRLVKMMPVIIRTQLRAVTFAGPGWVTGDCLWPVVCAVEQRTGEAALTRSRELMHGLKSAGRALAIRHFALSVLALADLIKSLGFMWRSGKTEHPDVVVTAVWFPLFAIFAAAPLFLYDRTAATEAGPLLQLDRAPELRVTSRPLSLSSTVWLLLGVLYVLWQPVTWWIFGAQ
jgi:serine/threonine protein kinase